MQVKPFKLERLSALYEFSSKYLLSVTDCETFTTEEIINLEQNSLELLKKQRLGYTDSPGGLALRKQISTLYQQITADNILAVAGGEEAIFIFMNTALNSGDHVIVQTPCYQSLIEIPKAIGCEISKWFVDEKNNWELDIEFLLQNIKTNTKAIILNLPHNPTGYLMKKSKFLEIINIAKKNNLLVFCDEVFRFLEYDESDRLPPACEMYENAISLGGMSKPFGLSGLCIG